MPWEQVGVVRMEFVGGFLLSRMVKQQASMCEHTADVTKNIVQEGLAE